jgi:hypothetical protein
LALTDAPPHEDRARCRVIPPFVTAFRTETA